ncbi:hypothetical protein DPMN_156297 [Dreissena polymorpha]|uniref:Uncharacterized protein n=1 Tax=Dreissena polymorpha TaxID=45954 RepID=A0A9D4FS20_DREPO|nr:hypothetical protein DPMN_156297 [Dreissena polymorpha]
MASLPTSSTASRTCVRCVGTRSPATTMGFLHVRAVKVSSKGLYRTKSSTLAWTTENAKLTKVNARDVHSADFRNASMLA